MEGGNDIEKKIPHPDRLVAYMAYINRENNFQHHGYAEEMKQYQLMQSGDPAAVEEGQRMMRRMLPVGLSTDPVRNVKYLCGRNEGTEGKRAG